MAIILGILILLVCVLVHELGHWAAARVCGVPVIKAGIGLGYALWKRRIGNTFYQISLFPLGGFVLPLAGREIPPQSGTKDKSDLFFEKLTATGEVEMQLARDLISSGAKGLRESSILTKCIFYGAGCMFNLTAAFIAAFALSGVFLSAALPSAELKIAALAKNSKAEAAGFAPGDVIASVNGKRPRGWFNLTQVPLGAEQALQVVVSRSAYPGKTVLMKIALAPASGVRAGERFDPYEFGIVPLRDSSPLGLKNRLIFAAAWLKEMCRIVMLLPQWEKGGGTDGQPSEGFIGSLSALGQSLNRGRLFFLNIIILVNLILAVVNLLPLPGFDGSKLFVLLLHLFFGPLVSAAAKERLDRYAVPTLAALLAMVLVRDLIALLN